MLYLRLWIWLLDNASEQLKLILLCVCVCASKLWVKLSETVHLWHCLCLCQKWLWMGHCCDPRASLCTVKLTHYDARVFGTVGSDRVLAQLNRTSVKSLGHGVNSTIVLRNGYHISLSWPVQVNFDPIEHNIFMLTIIDLVNKTLIVSFKQTDEITITIWIRPSSVYMYTNTHSPHELINLVCLGACSFHLNCATVVKAERMCFCRQRALEQGYACTQISR